MTGTRAVFACRNCLFTIVEFDGKERLDERPNKDEVTPAFKAATHAKESGHQVERFVFP